MEMWRIMLIKIHVYDNSVKAAYSGIFVFLLIGYIANIRISAIKANAIRSFTFLSSCFQYDKELKSSFRLRASVYSFFSASAGFVPSPSWG